MAGDQGQELVAEWKDRLGIADKFVEKLHEEWNDLDNELCDSHWPENVDLLATLQTVHLAWADWIITQNACLATHPQFYITPEWGTTTDAVDSQQYLCNHYARSKDLAMPTTGARCLFEGWAYGAGVAEVGYGVPGPRIGLGDDVRRAAEKGMVWGCPFCGAIYVRREGGECRNCGESLAPMGAADIQGFGDAARFLSKGRAWLEWRPMRNIRWDPSAPWPWEKPGWLSVDTYPTLAEVQSNPAYDPEIVRELHGNAPVSKADETHDAKQEQRTALRAMNAKTVQLRTIWIRKVEVESDSESWWERLIITPESDKPLLREVNPWPVTRDEGESPSYYPHPKAPLIFCHPWEIHNHPLPMGHFGMHRSLYYEMSLQSTLELNHCQRDLPQWYYDPRKVTPASAIEMAKGIPHLLLPIEGLADSPSPPIQAKPQSGLGADHYRRSDKLEHFIGWISGINDITRAQPVDTSATQARMLNAPTLIMQSFSRAVTDFYSEAVSVLMKTEAHHMLTPRWFSYPGEAARFVYPEELTQPSTIEAVESSTMFENDRVEMKQLMEYVAGLQQRGAAYADFRYLDKLIASRFSTLRFHIDEVFPSLDDQAQPEAENRLMFAGIPAPPATQGNLNAHMLAHNQAMQQATQLPEPARSGILGLIQQHSEAEIQTLGQRTAAPGGRNAQGTPEAIASAGRVAVTPEQQIENPEPGSAELGQMETITQ